MRKNTVLSIALLFSVFLASVLIFLYRDFSQAGSFVREQDSNTNQTGHESRNTQNGQSSSRADLFEYNFNDSYQIELTSSECLKHSDMEVVGNTEIGYLQKTISNSKLDNEDKVTFELLFLDEKPEMMVRKGLESFGLDCTATAFDYLETFYKLNEVVDTKRAYIGFDKMFALPEALEEIRIKLVIFEQNTEEIVEESIVIPGNEIFNKEVEVICRTTVKDYYFLEPDCLENSFKDSNLVNREVLENLLNSFLSN